MLQQTTVAAVIPYYHAFLRRWPTVRDLAAATLDEILAAWSGLGYYARARNLYRAAIVIARDFDGMFPGSIVELVRLPGVGPYTARAIAAIAFGTRVAALDANAERVMARYFAILTPIPRARKRLQSLVETLVPASRAGDFAQALMDLGAGICAPRKPKCVLCPLHPGCQASARGIEELLPAKTPKRFRPVRRGAAFIASDVNGAVLLLRRPDQGLLGGMLQPPLGPWTNAFPTSAEIRKQAPAPVCWRKRPGCVRHAFTHFVLEIEVYVATLEGRAANGAIWISPDRLNEAALPTVMRKIIAYGLSQDA